MEPAKLAVDIHNMSNSEVSLCESNAQKAGSQYGHIHYPLHTEVTFTLPAAVFQGGCA